MTGWPGVHFSTTYFRVGSRVNADVGEGAEKEFADPCRLDLKTPSPFLTLSPFILFGNGG
jgi:hypothetical protein